MIHIIMDINEQQDQRYTQGDNTGRDLYLLGVNVLVLRGNWRDTGFFILHLGLIPFICTFPNY